MIRVHVFILCILSQADLSTSGTWNMNVDCPHTTFGRDCRLQCHCKTLTWDCQESINSKERGPCGTCRPQYDLPGYCQRHTNINDDGRMYVYVSNNAPPRNSEQLQGSICQMTRLEPNMEKIIIQCQSQLVDSYITILQNQSQSMRICEISVYECENFMYGEECVSECNCLNVTEVCDKVTGACQSGCALGYHGLNCAMECLQGKTFGSGCTGECHCKDKTKCNTTDGVCSDGICAASWMSTGDKANCQKQCDYGRYGEGCTKLCNCRNDKSCNKLNGVCQNGGCTQGYYRTSDNTPCEKQCGLGTFGYDCRNRCHCTLNELCLSFNGNCTNGECADGYASEGPVNTCQKKCLDGKFGKNCMFSCHCASSQECNHIHGACEPNGLCSDGYINSNGSFNCQTPCPKQKFGKNCESTCNCRDGKPCHHVTGQCAECLNGYTGVSCAEECDAGFYGQRCASLCHCAHNQHCNHRNGACSPDGLCADGYTNLNCSINCQAKCSSGTYGKNCLSLCHCAQESNCNHVDGTCSNGKCESGWQSTDGITTCQLRDDRAKTDAIIPGYAVAAIVLAFIFLIVSAVLAVCLFVYVRKFKATISKKNNEKEGLNSNTEKRLYYNQQNRKNTMEFLNVAKVTDSENPIEQSNVYDSLDPVALTDVIPENAYKKQAALNLRTKK